jgi:uncharacterized protein
MAHPNEELMRRGYEAFTNGDLQTIDELFADDIVWHVPGNNQLSGEYRGKEEVFGNFGKLVELTGGSFRLEIHDVLANDEHVVVLVRATAEREGRKLDDRSMQLWHVEDGKATEQWLYPEDPQATDEFWGS